MTHQCRMGHAPALDHLPLDAKPAHRTPQRQRLTAEEEERRRGMDVPPMDIWSARHSPAETLTYEQLMEDLAGATPLVPPSAPKFKVGDTAKVIACKSHQPGAMLGRTVTIVLVDVADGAMQCENNWWWFNEELEPLPPPAPTGVWRSGKPERDGEYTVRDPNNRDSEGGPFTWDGCAWFIVSGRESRWQDWEWLDTPQEPEAAS